MKTKQLKLTKTSQWMLLAFMTIAISSCSNDDDKDVTEPDPTPPVEENLPVTLDCNAFQANNSEAITVLENRNDGVDYIIPCIASVEVDLQIEAGVVIAFEDAAGMIVRSGASLSAEGTSDNPISFTGLTPTKGSWKGIMSSSPSVKNKFDYVVIQYAGDGGLTSNSDPASLILLSESYFRISNTTIKDGLEYGISAPGQEYDVEITDCTISGCEIPLFLDTNIIPNLSGGDFKGNQTDVIRVSAGGKGAINKSQTWKKFPIPYRVDDIVVVDGAKWTIDPGVVIEFEETRGLLLDELSDDGSAIIAKGTPEEPIIFTGETKIPGSWKALSIRRTSSVQNILDNVIVEYAGGEGTGGAIEMWVDPVLTVSNTTIRNSKGCALFTKYKPENPNLTDSKNRIENVAGGYLCGE